MKRRQSATGLKGKWTVACLLDEGVHDVHHGVRYRTCRCIHLCVFLGLLLHCMVVPTFLSSMLIAKSRYVHIFAEGYPSHLFDIVHLDESCVNRCRHLTFLGDWKDKRLGRTSCIVQRGSVKANRRDGEGNRVASLWGSECRVLLEEVWGCLMALFQRTVSRRCLPPRFHSTVETHWAPKGL
jgi:hypothetical protein